MYAVITSGGKQYKIKEGETLKVEKLVAEPGTSIDFDQVLMLAVDDKVKVGDPYVKGAKVSVKVLGHGRGKKIKIIKFKRRKHYDRQMGHRQDFTELKVTKIAH